MCWFSNDFDRCSDLYSDLGVLVANRVWLKRAALCGMSRPPRVLGELGLVEQALLLVQERPEKGFAQFRDDRKAVSKLRIFFYLRLREFLE